MPQRFHQLRFGEFLPDLPPYDNPGALEARNVIPELRSYRPLRSLVTSTDALPAPAVGSFWAQAADNTIFNFAGTASGLFRLTGTTWTDVSITGGYSGVENWEFVKFGEQVIAFARGVAPQTFTLGTSTQFADLGGSPPLAGRAAVIQNFIVTGDNNLEVDTLRWSGFNNAVIWPPGNVPNQADFQELFGRGGRIQRIVPGDFGLVFTEHSIWRMDYAGSDLIFALAEIEPNRGTPAPNSVTWTGRQIFYYTQEGFFTTRGDGASENIGNNRVNRWFESRASAADLGSMRGAVDRANRLVIWAFSAAGGTNDSLIIYNWGANRWSYAEIDTQLITDNLSAGFTLDGLDGPLPLGIDQQSINVDSTEFQGGALNFIAFDTANRRASFSGQPLAGVLDTKEISDPSGRALLTTSVRPLVDGELDASTVSVGTRGTQGGGTPSFSSPVTLNSIGEANVRTDARYQRFRVNLVGDYTFAQGVEVDARPRGRR